MIAMQRMWERSKKCVNYVKDCNVSRKYYNNVLLCMSEMSYSECMKLNNFEVLTYHVNTLLCISMHSTIIENIIEQIIFHLHASTLKYHNVVCLFM